MKMLHAKFESFWTNIEVSNFFFRLNFRGNFCPKWPPKFWNLPPKFFYPLYSAKNAYWNVKSSTQGIFMQNFIALAMIFFELQLFEIRIFLNFSVISHIFSFIKAAKIAIPYVMFVIIKSKPFGVEQHVSPFWKEE